LVNHESQKSLEKLVDPTGMRMMSPSGLKIYCWARMTLTFGTQVVMTQRAVTIICACHVWLKLVR